MACLGRFWGSYSLINWYIDRMAFGYNKSLNLTEGEVRKAIANTRSNLAAARFLGISIDSWKKYASQYIDRETGQSLYDLHKNQAGKGIHKKGGFSRKKADIFEILEGKHPNYSKTKLKSRLLREGIFPECCNKCGFDERRITDFSVPLVLIWKDGNQTNHKEENLEFICYNCYFLLYDDVFKRGENIRFKGY